MVKNSLTLVNDNLALLLSSWNLVNNSLTFIMDILTLDLNTLTLAVTSLTSNDLLDFSND
jgi:hypothetical protein